MAKQQDESTEPVLIAVSADRKLVAVRPFHAVAEKYLQAVTAAMGAIPLIIPALTEAIDLAALLERFDGVLLTGSPSNVHPALYGVAASAEHQPYDQARDELTLALIRLALAKGIPLLAICRGMQELNVALGGTLHAALHELPRRLDHRRPDSEDAAVQYGPHHEVHLSAGSSLARIAATERITVNSLHRQGIDRLAEGLVAEAYAPDGTIEAVRVKHAPAFAIGVQWHPEYQATRDAFSVRLFAAFAEAARIRARQRTS